MYEVDADDNRNLVSSGDINIVSSGESPIYSSGVVTFLRAHGGDIVSVRIERFTDRTQLVDYNPYGPFPAETHEFALDKLTLIDQELGVAGGGSAPPDTNLDFVPLAGTATGRPVTGDIRFSVDGENTWWALNQGNLFGLNTMLLESLGASSEAQIVTRDASGNPQQFFFYQDGGFGLPTKEPAINVHWQFTSGEFLGTDNTLWLKPWDNVGQAITDGQFVLQTGDADIFTFSQLGYANQTGVVTASNADQDLATVKFVKDSIGGGGTLPPTNVADVLIANDSGAWKISDYFAINEYATPGQADVALTGHMFFDSVGGGGLEGALIRCDEVNGGTTFLIEFPASSLAEGGIIAFCPDTFGAGDEILMGNGYISLPKDPATDFHAATKQYVDSKAALPDGVQTNDMIRWDGLAWVTAPATAYLSSSGNLGAQTLQAQNLAANVGGIPVIGDFGILEPNANLTVNNDGDITCKSVVAVNGTLFSTLLTTGRALQVGINGSIENAPYDADEVRRNDQNNNFTGKERGPNGSAASPTFSFTNSDSTGIFRAANNSLGFTTNGGERGRFTSSGALLLGVTDPGGFGTGDCLISGNFSSQTLAGQGDGDVYHAFGTLYTNTSDIRLKEVTGENPYGLDAIMQIETFAFEWKEDGRESIGWAAQDMINIVPHAVSYNAESDSYGISSAPLVTTLIKAVQEQQSHITALEDRLARLEELLNV